MRRCEEGGGGGCDNKMNISRPIIIGLSSSPTTLTSYYYILHVCYYHTKLFNVFSATIYNNSLHKPANL